MQTERTRSFPGKHFFFIPALTQQMCIQRLSAKHPIVLHVYTIFVSVSPLYGHTLTFYSLVGYPLTFYSLVWYVTPESHMTTLS